MIPIYTRRCWLISRNGSKRVINHNIHTLPSPALSIKQKVVNLFSSQNEWKQAIANAETLVHPSGGSVISPKDLIGQDLSLLTENIKKLLGSGHPVLNTISNYYFSQQGKHIRPLIVLLMSQATSTTPKSHHTNWFDQSTLDTPISNSKHNIHLKETPFTYQEVAIPSPIGDATFILPSQKRLAEITEMIHTASLLHDDVIDCSLTRRSSPSANAEFGNKMAILSGDFLLARASVSLARLRNSQVVELLATVISNLVEGEFMQLRNSAAPDSEKSSSSRFDYYLEKTYMKTASLIAKSCRATTVLGGCTEEIGDIAYSYGKNIGLAFQVIDDTLDFVVSAEQFGKPVNADLKLGLATAPVLYAAEMYPELWPLIERKFNHEGDVAKTLKLVFESDGIDRTKLLASKFVDKAVESALMLPPSKSRDALINLTKNVLNRTK